MRFIKEQSNGIIVVLIAVLVLAWAYFAGTFDNGQAAEWYFQKGMEYHQRREFDEAITAFNTAIDLRSDYAEAYAGRCGSYWGLERFEEALSDCNHSLELDENLTLGYINRCFVLAHNERVEEALADCNHALSLEPESGLAFGRRGSAYYQLADYNLALEDFNRAIELEPSNTYFHLNRGFTYIYLELYPEAITDFERVIELDNTYVQAYGALALLYYQLGESRAAFQVADAMIEAAGTSAEAFYLRGYLYSLDERFPEAEADFLRSLELDVELEESYLELGYIYLERGAEERALHFFCQYLEYGGEISGYLSFTMNNLGECSVLEATAEATSEQ